MNVNPPCRIDCDKGVFYLEGKYDVLLNEKVIGTADVHKEGLYYVFQCLCNLPDKEMYQIRLSCDGQEFSLGTCVPILGKFGIKTRVPIKKFNKGTPIFSAVTKRVEQNNWFIPVDKEVPFLYLAQLDSAYFDVQGGIAGVCIKPNQSGTYK